MLATRFSLPATPRFSGLYFDEFAPDSAWMRDTARLELPPSGEARSIRIVGEYRAHPDATGRFPELRCRIPGGGTATLNAPASVAPSSPWELTIALPVGRPLADAGRLPPPALELTLEGVAFTNFLAWMGRLTGLDNLRRYRAQGNNRQLRLLRVEDDRHEVIYDFSQRHSAYSPALARRHLRLGINVVGFLTAHLGIGESARSMVRAADAAGIPAALVPLKLHCRNPLDDRTYAARLAPENPHPVNVFHVDPPAAHDLERHHGREFFRGRYNIGYFAWELPEFPDGWVSSIGRFDEIWCPSDFTRDAVAAKSPAPVHTMPHSIAFARPPEPRAELRARFGLPSEGFLFLCLFDLNSYAERKNPAAAVAAYRASGLAGTGAGLVIKVHSAASHVPAVAALRESLRDLPGALLLAETYSREDVYRLQAACDSLVSLHRAEGFGLAVAECMYLGKPVVASDWSATAEFVDRGNGCPIPCRPVEIARTSGPYGRGGVWAEPDAAEAGRAMRALATDPALASRLGAAARATIEERFSPAAVGARYRRRLENLALW